MDDEFWTQSGQTVTAQQSYQPPQHHQEHNEQQFDFSANQSNNFSYNSSTQNTYQQENYTSSSQNNIIYQDQTAKAIRQEEERIQQKLRQKADQQYQLKLKRKQEGRRQLQEFLNKKEQQTHQRRQQNLRKQQKLLQELKATGSSQGWTKVSKNIGIKQGQYKGKKDINRMREAIIHKRDDQNDK